MRGQVTSTEVTKSKPVARFGPDNRCAFGNSFDTLAVRLLK